MASAHVAVDDSSMLHDKGDVTEAGKVSGSPERIARQRPFRTWCPNLVYSDCANGGC